MFGVKLAHLCHAFTKNVLICTFFPLCKLTQMCQKIGLTPSPIYSNRDNKRKQVKTAVLVVSIISKYLTINLDDNDET